MSARKRIRNHILAVTGGGGGGPSPGGTIGWGPDFGGDDGDRFKVQAVLAQSKLGLRGAINASAAVTMPALALRGGVGTNGVITMPKIGLRGDTGVSGTMTGAFVIDNLISSDDMYLDEGSSGTNYGGAAALLAKTSAAVGNNEQITYIAWDTRFITGTVVSADIELEIATSSALGETVSIDVYTHPTQPFDESTATWDNAEQPAGTNRETLSQAVTTTPTVYTLSLGSSARSNMTGNWTYLRIQGASALGLNTITTTSKEGTNRPSMALEHTIE